MIKNNSTLLVVNRKVSDKIGQLKTSKKVIFKHGYTPLTLKFGF
jgi:hypothetical protein